MYPFVCTTLCDTGECIAVMKPFVIQSSSNDWYSRIVLAIPKWFLIPTALIMIAYQILWVTLLGIPYAKVVFSLAEAERKQP